MQNTFNISEMIGFKSKEDLEIQFGYAIAYNKLSDTYPKETKEISIGGGEKKMLTYFPIAEYTISIYQEPGTVAFTIYFPMFILSWVLLGVFQCEFDLNGRVANIAVLLLAYIAFIPSARKIIPPVSYPTLSDVTLWFNMFGCLTTLLESFLQAHYTNIWGS